MSRLRAFFGLDFDALFVNAVGTVTVANSNLIRIEAGATRQEYLGRFEYDQSGLSDGVIQTFQSITSGQITARITQLGVDVVDYATILDSGNIERLLSFVFSRGDDFQLSNDDDIVSGFAGADTIRTNGGDDVARGGVGNDILIGGSGRDFLFGDAGSDRLVGGGDSDRLTGGAGGDTLIGASGQDTLRGQVGDDFLNGGGGQDRLFGAAGRDNLKGGGRGDLLVGGGDNDRLFGGGGNDTLKGGAGRDGIVAGKGSDKLFGGGDADVFLFSANDGANVIGDYQDGLDKFRILTGAENFSQLNVSRSGDDTEIKFADTSIVVEDVLPRELSAADFLF